MHTRSYDAWYESIAFAAEAPEYSRGQDRGINRENGISIGIGNGCRHVVGDFDGAGLGHGGSGRALGPGGIILRDGSYFCSAIKII